MGNNVKCAMQVVNILEDLNYEFIDRIVKMHTDCT